VRTPMSIRERLRAGQLRRLTVASALAVLLAAAQIAPAQTAPSPLTLQKAVQMALEKNPARKAALADTKAAAAGIMEARSALLPRLTFSETATRGDDPVYVFGGKLRQRRFTTDDFALNQLNTPLPFGNFSTRFGGTWNLFDSFASWHGVNRARLMDEATIHQLDRTNQEIVFRVVEAYYGLLLANKQQDVAGQAVKTAQSILSESQSRYDAGLVVESDLLTAKVRLAERRQELIQATNNAALAQTELNVAMGAPVDSSWQPAEVLAEHALPAPVLTQVEQEALANRADLKRISSEEAAQQQSVAMAKSSFGPKLNAFAGWEMDNPTFLAGGGGNNWLGGVELQFDLFQGGAKKAELSREHALEEKAAAMKQAASDQVRLEVRQAFYAVDTSRQQLDVAREAIAQAQEGLRIVQDRYNSGLTTITDVLGAEEAVQRTQTDYWQAVYRYHISYAGLELASGALNEQSPVVKP
jgi:outer membrane protein